MKLERRYKIQKVLGPAYRLALADAAVDVDAKVAVSCNGWALAVVPIEVDASDRTGQLPAACISKLQSGDKVTLKKRLAVTGEALYRRAGHEHPAGTAAKRMKIWPSFSPGDKGTASVTLSAKLLHDLAHAIGASDSMVTLTFKPWDGKGNNPEPIIVKATDSDEAIGLLMPCRP